MSDRRDRTGDVDIESATLPKLPTGPAPGADVSEPRPAPNNDWVEMESIRTRLPRVWTIGALVVLPLPVSLAVTGWALVLLGDRDAINMALGATIVTAPLVWVFVVLAWLERRLKATRSAK